MDWDERYSEPGYAYGTAPNDFLASVAERIPKGRVLSLAEGEGRNGVFLASLGYEVTGVDGSQVGIAKARNLAAERGLSLTTIVSDLNQFHIRESAWQGIVACYCHLPSLLRKRLHREVVDGLKQRGVYILEAFSKEQLRYGSGGPSDLDMLMSLAELKEELAGLDFLHAVTVERDLCEGSKHMGLASVVQILAVKP